MKINLSSSYPFRPLVWLISLTFLGLIPPFQAYSQTNLQSIDSLKQVLEVLNIPIELQESWVETLEEHESAQESMAFKELMAEINKEIEDYLINGATQNQPQRKKKNFFKNLGNKVSAMTKKIKKEIDVTVPLEIAKVAEKNENYDIAFDNYEIVIRELEEQKEITKAIEWQEHIAELHETLKDTVAALEAWNQVKNLMVAHDQPLDNHIEKRMGNLIPALKELKKLEELEVLKELKISTPTVLTAPPSPPSPPVPPIVTPAIIRKKTNQIAKKATVIATAESKAEEIRKKAVMAERSKDYATSLQLNKQLMALEVTLQTQKTQIENDKRLLAENKLQLMEQQAVLDKQAVSLAQEKSHKQNLFIGLGLLAALAFSLYFLYANKQRDHQKLGIAYKKLATAQSNLKEAESRVKNLLKQQLSGAVANELMATGGVQKMEQRFVCIMFLDIRDFTPFVENLSPEEIIAYQNDVLGFMIEKVIQYGGVVNTIMGDGFMATFGAPVSSGNDCLQAHRAATEIMEMVKEKNESGKIPPTRIGIGLHAGYVVAGNVGTKERKQYSITGNPVIIASRLEQLNKKYKSTLIISKEVFDHLPEEVHRPQTYEEVLVKGRTEPVEIATIF